MNMKNKLKQFLSVLKFRDNAFIRLARCKDIDAESILPMAEEAISQAREEERKDILKSLPEEKGGGFGREESFNNGYNQCLKDITKKIKEKDAKN